jgi:hypothetical protein
MKVKKRDGQLLDVVISIGRVEISDSGTPYATSTILRVDWTGTVAELENLLSRSKRVAHVERLAAI